MPYHLVVMFSPVARIVAALLTVAAAVIIAAAIGTHDSLAGVAVGVVALSYIVAMAVLLICDFVVMSLRRSRVTVRQADHINR